MHIKGSISKIYFFSPQVILMTHGLKFDSDYSIYWATLMVTDSSKIFVKRIEVQSHFLLSNV